MAYSFRLKDEDLTAGLRRIALSQIDRALNELDDQSLSRSEVVHQLRKRCKKLRGLIRLVRPGFDDYSAENAAFRDAARKLSFVRDATALIETLDRIRERYRRQLAPDAFAKMHSALIMRRASLEREEVADALEAMGKTLRAARARVSSWTVDGDAAAIIAGGARKTYKRAGKAMAKARRTQEGEDLHEWRKRVKYHWYHARLLKRAWRPVMDAHVAEAAALSDDLGDHHDLIVFAEFLNDDPLTEDDAERRAFIALMRERRAVLEKDSFERGAKLFAEKPKRLAGRWADYWTAWRG